MPRRRGLELVTEIPQVAVVNRQGIEVSRQLFAGPAIGVFNRTFLPRRVWVAEPGLHAEPRLEIRPVGELGAAVKGDGMACGIGKGAQGIDQSVHDRLRLPVVVAHEHREAADRLTRPCRTSCGTGSGRIPSVRTVCGRQRCPGGAGCSVPG